MKKLYCFISACFIFISSVSLAIATECSYKNNLVTCKINPQHGVDQII